MEEQQIQDFVHRIALDGRVRSEMASNPAGILQLQDFSPRVLQIFSLLMPYFVLDSPVVSTEKWWHA